MFLLWNHIQPGSSIWIKNVFIDRYHYIEKHKNPCLRNIILYQLFYYYRSYGRDECGTKRLSNHRLKGKEGTEGAASHVRTNNKNKRFSWIFYAKLIIYKYLVCLTMFLNSSATGSTLLCRWICEYEEDITIDVVPKKYFFWSLRFRITRHVFLLLIVTSGLTYEHLCHGKKNTRL